MRIGTITIPDQGPDGSIDAVERLAHQLEADGFDHLWMANIFSLDAITALSIIGRTTSRIGLGTAVTPTYPRHPVAMAQQALTAAAATDNRFVLGIGLSHRIVIEDMFGLSYDKPARHMREYLEVLMPLLAGEAVSHDGEHYRVNCRFTVAGAERVPTVIAALGPAMLKIAGELADGTTTWMTGPKTLSEHIVPRITRAASAAGRTAPRIVASLPIALCSDVDAARVRLDKDLEIYGQIPSYRAMLDREGASGPADVALLGSEAELTASLSRLRDIGVTDFNAAVADVEPGARDRTLQFLAALHSRLA